MITRVWGDRRGAKALKSRPVNWLRDVTAFIANPRRDGLGAFINPVRWRTSTAGYKRWLLMLSRGSFISDTVKMQPSACKHRGREPHVWSFRGDFKGFYSCYVHLLPSFLPSSLYDSFQEEIVIKWNALPLHITVFHLAWTLLETFREMYCAT